MYHCHFIHGPSGKCVPFSVNIFGFFVFVNFQLTLKIWKSISSVHSMTIYSNRRVFIIIFSKNFISFVRYVEFGISLITLMQRYRIFWSFKHTFGWKRNIFGDGYLYRNCWIFKRFCWCSFSALLRLSQSSSLKTYSYAFILCHTYPIPKYVHIHRTNPIYSVCKMPCL